MGGVVKILSVPDGNYLQVVKTGIVHITKPASDRGESVTVSHNLGYVPMVIATNSNTPLPYVFPEVFDFTADGHGRVAILIYCSDITDTTVTFDLVTPEGTIFYTSEQEADITFYLLRVPAIPAS